jgi:lantibiotic modifying enzyme
MNKIIGSIYSGVVKEYKNSNDISILTGTSGKILFLGYLYNVTRSQVVKSNLESLIDYTINIIMSDDPTEVNLTYGGGITGFYWVINHLYQNKILLEDSLALKAILSKESDKIIASSLHGDFAASRYDFLYGYIGKGLYFLTKKESKLTKQVTIDILKALDKDKVRISDGRTTWIDVRRMYPDNHPDNERLVLADCGQAHGVLGIISYLCAVIEKFKSLEIAKAALNLLKPAVDWLLSEEIPTEKRRSFMFPMSINLLAQGTTLSGWGKLGWCYGDNIIAYVLYKAAAILKEEKYRQKADEITINSCLIPVEQSGVYENFNKEILNPTICHGASSIAHIFQKIYKYNRSPEVSAAIILWNNVTEEYTDIYLKSGELKSLVAGKEEEYDFLYGYSGIGLHLLSNTYSKYGWESCLMMD